MSESRFCCDGRCNQGRCCPIVDAPEEVEIPRRQRMAILLALVIASWLFVIWFGMNIYYWAIG